MFAVTIWDTKTIYDNFTVLAFDLQDILMEVEDMLLDSVWRLESEVYETGQAIEELDAWFKSEETLSGLELLNLSRRIEQTFEGQFLGEKDGKLWLLVEAIRGTEFLVVTPDSDIVSRLRQRFQDVRDSPEDADWYGKH